MTECYVCYEPCSEAAPCKCKTMYVHPSCVEMMKIYGKESCGVCGTPYECETPYEEIEPEWNPPPFVCLIVPTFLRKCYDSNDIDQIIDIFRFVVFFAIVLSIVSYINDRNVDLTPVTICVLSFICFCSIIGQTLRKPQHSLNQLRDHGTLQV